MTGLCWVWFERVPRRVIVQISVPFSGQLDNLFKCFFQPEAFKLIVETFRRLVKNLENVLVSFFVCCEFRDLVLESGADESDRSMNEIAQNIVEFCIDLPLELFPGEVRVPLFRSEADQCVAPIFCTFQLQGFVYPDADLAAFRESLAFELDVFGGSYFPWQVVSFVSGEG